MSKHFGDIGKDSRDLISDDFPSDGIVKLTTQSKTSDGLTAKATLKRHTKGGREQVETLIEPKYEWKEKNIEISGKLSTTSDFSGTVAVKDLIKGSKVEISGSTNEKSTTSKLVLSHKTDPVAAKVTFTLPLDKSPKQPPPKINGDVVFQYPDNLFVGANVFVDVHEKLGVKGEGAVGYTKDQWQITGRGSYTPSTLKEGSSIIWGVSFFHKVSDSIRWALDFETDQALKKGPSGVVAAEYKIDNFTTVKGKFSIKDPAKPEARIGLVGKQKINSFFSVNLGADLNARNILSGDSSDGPHTFGVEFKLQE